MKNKPERIREVSSRDSASQIVREKDQRDWLDIVTGVAPHATTEEQTRDFVNQITQ